MPSDEYAAKRAAAWENMRQQIDKGEWPYKALTTPIKVDPNIYGHISNLFYGDVMKKKRKTKQPKPTKREKELEASLQRTQEYYHDREKSWERTMQEKNAEIDQLKASRAELLRDKAFLQQLCQHLVSPSPR